MTSSGRGLHRTVVTLLGERIVRGELRPGDVIDLERLEEELSVSRTVLREALRVLRAKGLIDALPKRGTFVRPRSSWSVLDAEVIAWHGPEASKNLLADLVELRHIFEPSVARLAAQRRDQHDLDELDRALEHLTESTTAGNAGSAAFVAADIAFHRSMLAASHNELLLQLAVVLTHGLTLRDEVVAQHQFPGDDGFLVAHSKVLDAVRRGDARAAERRMRALLTSAAEDVDKALASGGDVDG